MALSIPRIRKNGKHGATVNASLTREYRIWHNAKRRCLDPLATRYDLYGGRGIRICDEWVNDFKAFADYMGPCPAGSSLDRIDRNGHYEPGNVKWSTQMEQMNNMSRNWFVTIDGTRMTVSQASRATGIAISTLRHRIKKGLMK